VDVRCADKLAPKGEELDIAGRNLTESEVADTTMGAVLLVVSIGIPLPVADVTLEANELDPVRPCADGASIPASFAAGSTSSNEAVGKSRARSAGPR
jgi:hypothetical protein